MTFDTKNIRQQFPILRESSLIYLDSAATTQKPDVVLAAMNTYYETKNANVHRGMHALAEAATIAYEDARTSVAKYLGAKKREVIFTKGCTESINLIAKTWGRQNLQKGDVIVLSLLEHHSNIVPWQQLQEEIGITIKWIRFDDHGELLLSDLNTYLDEGNVKLVSITALSNVLGTVTNLPQVIQMAHQAEALVAIDAAQLAAHSPINVTELDCDFLTLSAHKVYGPTGIGVLFAKKDLLETMPPFLGGGSMIDSVTTEGFTPTEIPHKFEAGTPPIAEAIGMHTALTWLNQFSWEDRQAHETELIRYANKKLHSISGLHIVGTPQLGCISFVIDGVHPHDLTEILGRQEICLRAGHHCTQPLHDHLGITATTRMSFGIYNTKEDIDSCISKIQTACQVLRI